MPKIATPISKKWLVFTRKTQLLRSKNKMTQSSGNSAKVQIDLLSELQNFITRKLLQLNRARFPIFSLNGYLGRGLGIRNM